MRRKNTMSLKLNVHVHSVLMHLFHINTDSYIYFRVYPIYMQLI